MNAVQGLQGHQESALVNFAVGCDHQGQETLNHLKLKVVVTVLRTLTHSVDDGVNQKSWLASVFTRGFLALRVNAVVLAPSLQHFI